MLIEWKHIFIVLTDNLTKTHACDTQQDAHCEKEYMTPTS
jgi:hypothetical protein